LPQPQLAKITRPRFHGAVVRKRLFAVLQKARAYPLVWIAGPPGAGKTTLVATYVTAMRIPCLWYQVDGGDGDAGTFFYYLGKAAAAATSQRRKPLPLSAEYASDLKSFSVRYFRELFARLPRGAVVVFDNYQDAPAERGLSAVLGLAIREIPEAINAIVISRTDPPEELAWAVISRRIATLGWQQLRLSLAETQQLARTRGVGDMKVVRTLHEQSYGWAAGAALMLERLRRDGTVGCIDRADAMDIVFAYFAGSIFDGASDDVRDVLMSTALFPRFTVALAQALCESCDVGKILDQLYRRHLFIERHAGAETAYQYHALFQAFLKQRARQHFGVAGLHARLQRAAALLAADGQDEAAFALWCEAGHWPSAASALRAAAPRLIGQGRLQTVQEWASRLPRSQASADPWIGYWVAMALQPIKPGEAGAALKQVFQAFSEGGDEIGQIMSAAGILDTIYTVYSDLMQMDPWLEVVARLLARNPVFPSPAFELRARQSLVGAVYRAPGHPLLKACVERVEALLKLPFDVNLKVVAGQRLAAYAEATTDIELSHRVFAEITPLLDSPELNPANAALFLNIQGYVLYIAWRIDEAFACLERARTLASKEGLAGEEFRALVYRGICERRTGRWAAAQRTFAALEAMPRPERGALLSVYEILRALMAYSRGDLDLAVAAARESLHLGAAAGNVFVEAMVLVFNAQFLIAAGDLEQASGYLERARTLTGGTAIDTALAYISLNEAHVAHLRGEVERRTARLKEALEFARTCGGARQRWFPEAMSALFPVALAEGIEPGVVRSLIRQFQVVPESPDVEGWPWPVKVRTLGIFEIRIDDVPLAFSRKVPRKTIALLKALISFGGQTVHEHKLVDALWPDEDGDDARKAFNMALHRLRKLLGDNDVIRQSGGALTLDRSRCWVDAFVFEHALDAAATSGGTLEQRPLGPLQRAVALYKGGFLRDDENAPWAVSLREKLRARFVQAVGRCGQYLEQSGCVEKAIDCYLSGLEADDLVEPFYQGLMRCYCGLDRRSEAIAAYRRMRETLSTTLGIRPCAQSERLYHRLQASQEERPSNAGDDGLGLCQDQPPGRLPRR
jgi:DNA-binding SARP family transcriptional activator